MQAQKKPPRQITRPENLTDDVLIELVQRQTFRYFWEGAHPDCGMARDRTGLENDLEHELVAMGGSGFARMAILVGGERGWIARVEAVERIRLILGFLERAPCYHGLFPHYMNGRTAMPTRFGRKDDGSDIVESAF